MKTSTKIILLLAVLVFAASLSMFVVSKIHDKNFKAGYVWTTKEVQPFSVIVGMGNTKFTIEGCDSNAIAYYVRKGHVSNLYVRNDTLFVQQTNISKESLSKVIVRAKSLRSIVVSPGDNVAAYTLKAGPLSLTCNGGDLTIENWDEKIKKAHSVTSMLDIVAKDSAEIYLSNLRIKKWTVKLNHTVLHTNEVFSNELIMILKNHSWARISPMVTTVSAMRDSTSFFIDK